jgi:hypothetical protein
MNKLMHDLMIAACSHDDNACRTMNINYVRYSQHTSRNIHNYVSIIKNQKIVTIYDLIYC